MFTAVFRYQFLHSVLFVETVIKLDMGYTEQQIYRYMGGALPAEEPDRYQN
jgi:hypothetical protein